MLSRSKFRKFERFQSDAPKLLSLIRNDGIWVEVLEIPDVIKDSFDNHFLAVAKHAKADYLITGNHQDFTMQVFEGVRIVNPAYYYANECFLV